MPPLWGLAIQLGPPTRCAEIIFSILATRTAPASSGFIYREAKHA